MINNYISVKLMTLNGPKYAKTHNLDHQMKLNKFLHSILDHGNLHVT